MLQKASERYTEEEGRSFNNFVWNKRNRFVLKKPVLRQCVKFNAKGSRFGAVGRALAFHQCVPGSIPGLGVICGLSLLVLYSTLIKNQYLIWFDLIWFVIRFQGHKFISPWLLRATLTKWSYYWFNEIKESICIKLEFNFQRVSLVHQYGRRDVMWKRSIVEDIARVGGQDSGGGERHFNFMSMAVGSQQPLERRRYCYIVQEWRFKMDRKMMFTKLPFEHSMFIWHCKWMFRTSDTSFAKWSKKSMKRSINLLYGSDASCELWF